MSETLCLADRLFAADNARGEIEDKLDDGGVVFERIGWDHYDCSLEVYDVPPDGRLSVEVQKAIYEAGFLKIYVNHTDKWETHYRITGRDGVFTPSDGWRVSYPHKRGENEKGIWVEKPVPTWPEAWMESGYVTIKEPLQQLAEKEMK